ncbi:MAG: hypothetical protein A2W93_08725 [Bacteroidetes bacterium GWF2_43_63]|nr:MAG: hypothetical protein A2W94_03070 [Bacteroidetes bacterium GWE2_42_42]OFY55215.1 MAG: hypothetical protein A2W93_08725 [Bacteroidetes bacterium GWF2_43_63]HBG70908.1 hypothetical protein [Bacteroidales bacterium]
MKTNQFVFLLATCILAALMPGVLYGQPASRVDSLYNELIVHFDELPEDSNTVKKMYEYAILCAENEGAWNSLKQPEVCYEGFRMSQRIGYQKGLQDFVSVLKQSFKQSEELPLIVVHTYPDAVNRKTFRLLHQFRKELHGGTVDYYSQAYDFYMSRKMFREAGIVRFWNAISYYDTENFAGAGIMFSEARTCFLTASDHYYLSRVALFYGCSHYYSGNYPAAINEFNLSENECLIIKDTSSLIKTLYNRGEGYLAICEYQNALDDFQQAYSLDTLSGNTIASESGQLKFARVYYALNQYSRSIQIAKLVLENARIKKDKIAETDALYFLSLVLVDAGQKDVAVDFLLDFIYLRDSLFTAEVNSFFDERELHWINKLGRQGTYQAFIDHERNKYFVEWRKSRLVVWGVIFLAIILAVFGIVLYRSNKNKKQANIYLNQLDKTRNLFFSIIAHDLRGPLIATDYMLKPAISHAEEKNDQVLVSSLKEIEMQNSRRKLLLDNLLSWAAMQRGSMKCNLQPVAIKPLIEKVISFCQFAAKQTGASVIIDQLPDVTLLADPDMMELIMRNLIDNSLKHGGHEVEIKISGAVEGPNLRFTFDDNGKGMSEEAVEKFISGTTPDNTGNSKLGLSLIRYFIEQQNGKIFVQSTTAGCSLSFTIPLLINDKTNEV